MYLSRMYPGGSFDPAGLSKGDDFETLKRKEIANGRLAMVAFLGILAQNQAYPDGLGPVQALLNHVADPWQHLKCSLKLPCCSMDLVWFELYLLHFLKTVFFMILSFQASLKV